MLTGRPDLDRAALLEIVRSLPRLDPLSKGDHLARKAWLQQRMSRFHLMRLPTLNDGMRLPGREGLTRPAAVLVPIVNRPDGLTLLLTQRSDTLPDHPGQISFPGGRQEPDDGSAAETALRESEEEIGLHRRHVEILGEVGNYETVSGYSVVPVVGWVEPPIDLTPDPVEVADAFEVPLPFVLDPDNFVRHHREVNGIRRDFFSCTWQDRFIWGATAAMILLFSYALAVPAESVEN